MTTNNNKIELCIVDIKHLTLYSISNSKEQAEEKFFKAIDETQKRIKSWEANIKQYGTCKSFEDYLIEAKNRQFEIMSMNEFVELEKNHYDSLPLTEITEDRYFEMMNVLPPIYQRTKNNIEMFCMSEFLTSSFTSQYIHDRTTNKFYHKTVDVTDQSTWGDNFIK